ncbi:MAG: tRNA (5-methylaminomethyl-2-thiouridine)(34)-methyltransferase MnmD [Pseudomonadales bacterium]
MSDRSPTSGPRPANAALPAARIRYEHDQPYSVDFQDIYHTADGDAEVRRVFIAPCQLDALARERAALAGAGRDLLRIGETGFGSGYNFVIAAQLCLDAGARLHFVSFEAAPLDAADFATIAAHRGRAHPLYSMLDQVYPPRIRGWHRRYFMQGRICLSLWWGSAADGLADLAGRQRQPFDAWFLDGFAPDRNPELWQPELFRSLATLCTRGTRVATFTSAGQVRRGLEAAGFAMRRVDQRPHKHESLAGCFQQDGLSGFAAPRQVRIAGAGLAGASAAWHLARAGFAVRVMDPLAHLAVPSAAADAAAGDASATALPGSHMATTALHGRLLTDGTLAAGLRCHGYLYAASAVRELAGFTPGGVLQVPGGTQPQAKLRAVFDCYGESGSWVRWLGPKDASALAAWPLPDGGLHFADAGAVDTPTLVRSMLTHQGIEVAAEALTEPDPKQITVLACGAGSREFPAARYLELAAVYGQLDYVDLPGQPRLPLVGNGYLVPGRGLTAVGASYEYRPWDPETATRANLAQLQGRAYTWRGRQRGVRSVSSDRTAIAGMLDDSADGWGEGLYASAGHGSSGNVSAHLAAAVLTALISGEFAPLERRLEAALAPLRFRERQARRGYRHGAGD